ncbi:unnamed protein product [marine sediment metagenome]|uniref:Uncharacterized protein n=1 Tax=marine sediment metagenome TaxID=412755 RepID=X0Z976_9ZZZZ
MITEEKIIEIIKYVSVGCLVMEEKIPKNKMEAIDKDEVWMSILAKQIISEIRKKD